VASPARRSPSTTAVSLKLTPELIAQGLLGSIPLAGSGVAFRVWAPNATHVDVLLYGASPLDTETVALHQEDAGDRDAKTRAVDSAGVELDDSGRTGGYFSGIIVKPCVGRRYQYLITAGAEGTFPRNDPCGRQLVGFGQVRYSVVCERYTFRWPAGEDRFKPAPKERIVMYEMHPGSAGHV
jgi:1,4-alpha-glucan branching enzyme